MPPRKSLALVAFKFMGQDKFLCLWKAFQSKERFHSGLQVNVPSDEYLRSPTRSTARLMSEFPNQCRSLNSIVFEGSTLVPFRKCSSFSVWKTR